MAATVETSPKSKHKVIPAKVLGLFKARGDSKDSQHGVFGLPLETAVQSASASVTLVRHGTATNVQIPLVVATCGSYIRDKGLTEGIFRVSGSSERIQKLQEIFDSPKTSSDQLDWDPYTVFDAADVLRRYLGQLPDPVVPHKSYKDFLAPMIHGQDQTTGSDSTSKEQLAETYQKLVGGLPPEHHRLLVYLLDLLAFFAFHSEKTLMTSRSLATIFQPAILTLPLEQMAISEITTCQEVIEYLIDMGDTLALDGKV